MTDLRKAAEMALERLESHEYWMDERAIKALRQALAQPEQEPVAQLQEEQFGRGQVMWFNKLTDKTLLYTAPPKREWVSLDKYEIVGLTCECVDDGEFTMQCAFDFAQAIDEKLKEKNFGRV